MSTNGSLASQERGTSWYIFLLLLVCYAFVLPRWADWNVNSRMDLVLAVVDRGTLTIDAYRENTGDYAFFEGHAYSDKAPGTSLAAIPPYLLFRALGGRTLTEALAPRANSALRSTLDPGGRGLSVDSLYVFVATAFVTFWVVSLPAAVLGVLLYRFLALVSGNSQAALLVSLAYGLATPALAYANNLYGHQPTAFLLFAAFYLVFQSTRGLHPAGYALLAGITLGLAVITEYPAALIAGGVGLYAIYKWRSWRQLTLLVVGGLPSVIVLAAYNWAIFHTPLPVGYLYSPLYTDLHHTGLVSLTYPHVDALWELAFGLERGLFLLSPFLMLAIPGLVFFALLHRWRAEFFVTLWAIVSFFLFNSSSAMWQGGFAIGPRYLVPMLPFLAIPVVFVAASARSRMARAGLGLVLALSFVLIWATNIAGQQFPQYQGFPLIEYTLPRLYLGDIARNLGMLLDLRGPASLLPLPVVVLAITGAYLWSRRDLAHARAHANGARAATL